MSDRDVPKPNPSAGDPSKAQLPTHVVTSLYDAHHQELQRFLDGLLRDSALAHDVLQTTFARLVEKGAQTRPASRKAWLFRVAYHEAMALRRRAAVGQRVVERAAWIRDEQEAAADLPALRGEEVEAVQNAMARLSPQQRQVVEMRIYQEKKFAEIANELGIPLGTALGRMRQALAKLKDWMQSD